MRWVPEVAAAIRPGSWTAWHHAAPGKMSPHLVSAKLSIYMGKERFLDSGVKIKKKKKKNFLFLGLQGSGRRH